MSRSATKCEKEEKTEKAKLKKVSDHTQFVALLITWLIQALAKGNVEGGRIHAENAIRQKNQVSPAYIDTVCGHVSCF